MPNAEGSATPAPLYAHRHTHARTPATIIHSVFKRVEQGSWLYFYYVIYHLVFS
ncbi:hypothetical protein M407DRAFT_244305 [Tulasnella calospora MUT 4182]|uniref:Uncharacterized protein n=1 Tax=Tulasnella calospora MUT 4182 TaxID=1051891 RepID=A0A0C3KTH2_9AGAM|nr:hypothetical protein M407DRAFT_244305 [Tulasnella calospora MUT 4182]